MFQVTVGFKDYNDWQQFVNFCDQNDLTANISGTDIVLPGISVNLEREEVKSLLERFMAETNIHPLTYHPEVNNPFQ